MESAVGITDEMTSEDEMTGETAPTWPCSPERDDERNKCSTRPRVDDTGGRLAAFVTDEAQPAHEWVVNMGLALTRRPRRCTRWPDCRLRRRADRDRWVADHPRGRATGCAVPDGGDRRAAFLRSPAAGPLLREVEALYVTDSHGDERYLYLYLFASRFVTHALTVVAPGSGD